MKRSPWTQERAVLSPGCRRARFLPKSDPAAPFFVLHRPAQRMGAIGAGDRCSLWLLRPSAVLQRCHIGAASVPPWCRKRASMVLERRKRSLSLAACRQGAMTEPYACSLGALVVLPCPVPFATCMSSWCRERVVSVPCGCYQGGKLVHFGVNCVLRRSSLVSPWCRSGQSTTSMTISQQVQAPSLGLNSVKPVLL